MKVCHVCDLGVFSRMYWLRHVYLGHALIAKFIACQLADAFEDLEAAGAQHQHQPLPLPPPLLFHSADAASMKGISLVSSQLKLEIRNTFYICKAPNNLILLSRHTHRLHRSTSPRSPRGISAPVLPLEFSAAPLPSTLAPTPVPRRCFFAGFRRLPGCLKRCAVASKHSRGVVSRLMHRLACPGCRQQARLHFTDAR